MDKTRYYPYTVDNQIAIRNHEFTLIAKGESANRIAEAAAFAIVCIGLAALIKAAR